MLFHTVACGATSPHTQRRLVEDDCKWMLHHTTHMCWASYVAPLQALQNCTLLTQFLTKMNKKAFRNTRNKNEDATQVTIYVLRQPVKLKSKFSEIRSNMHCLCYRNTLQCTLIQSELCDMTIVDPHTGKFGVWRVNPQHFQSLNLLCQLWHCLEEVCNLKNESLRQARAGLHRIERNWAALKRLTKPKSATWKIGASPSLLIATMTWIARNGLFKWFAIYQYYWLQYDSKNHLRKM